MRKLAAIIGVFGLVAGSAVLAEDNSGLAPLATEDRSKMTERVLGVCRIIDNAERKKANGELYVNSDDIYAASSALSYFQKFEHRNDFTSEDVSSVKTRILQKPTHGSLIEVVTNPDLSGDYRYVPNLGYEGKDSAEILVEIKGMQVKVRYFIHATKYDEPNAYADYCEQPSNPWKISQGPYVSSILTAEFKEARLE